MLVNKYKYIDIIGRVIISTPRGHLLQRSGYVGVDMHSHTHFSDGDASVKTLLSLARLRGIGVAITDHNEIKGNLLASRQKKVMTVPGIEVNSCNGRELLMYFYNHKDLNEFYLKYIKGKEIPSKSALDYFTLKWSEEEIIEGGKKFNALMTVPHPFGIPNRGSYAFFESNRCFADVQGIEVINSLLTINKNRSAFYWAKNAGKTYFGGSDTHTRFGIGRAVTVTYAVESVEDFIDNLKKHRSGVVGKELPFFGKVGGLLSATKNLLFTRK